MSRCGCTVELVVCYLSGYPELSLKPLLLFLLPCSAATRRPSFLPLQVAGSPGQGVLKNGKKYPLCPPLPCGRVLLKRFLPGKSSFCPPPGMFLFKKTPPPPPPTHTPTK